MTSSTPEKPPRSSARSCRGRISRPSMPSRWAGRSSTPLSRKYRRIPGSIFPGTPGSRSSRRSGRVARRGCWTLDGEGEMAKGSFDDDDTEEDSDYDELRDALYQKVFEFADEEDVS